MALINKVDPLVYLNASETDARILNAVIEAAQDLDRDRWDDRLKAVGAHVARALAKIF